jgi:ABC-type multidrug transport system permease subunit
MVVTQTEDRSIVYYPTFLKNGSFNYIAPAMLVNVMVVQAIVVTQTEDRSIVYYPTVLINGIFNYIAPAMVVNISVHKFVKLLIKIKS